MKKIIKISLVLAVAMLISVMAVATVSATTDIKNEKTNTGITIDSKEKKIASYKITWNANGGKIGSKKTKITSVKRGSKIKKLAANPKRSGFSFKGWFTKKNGGKKITKNTKISKKVTFFAQWKKTRTLNSEEKKLVGIWGLEWDGSVAYAFQEDGTFIGLTKDAYYNFGMKGNYSLKNGVLTMKYLYSHDYGSGWGPWGSETIKYEGERGVKFSTRDGKPAFTYGVYGKVNLWFIKDKVGLLSL